MELDKFPIVGLGASAGGLEAVGEFLTAMPDKPGMAFVLIQHLDPRHQSLTVELLQKHTSISVQQAGEGDRVRPDCLFVIPPNCTLTIHEGRLHLSPPSEQRGLRLPIDRFFKSLAEDAQEQAVVIVLSGTGSDGAQGLRQVKANGGLVISQTPETAAYDGMPRNAIATGDVDFVLPVGKMPELLLMYREHAYLKTDAAIEEDQQYYVSAILSLLLARTGKNFRGYKRGTINRRVQRRMNLIHIHDIGDYRDYLRDHADEVQALSDDLLIGVTEFFREPDAWMSLEQNLLPLLTKNKQDNEPVRVWVPGCSTGEEAYSMVMVCTEALSKAHLTNDLIVFATDIDKKALEVARAGVYPEGISCSVPRERLKRYFVREGDRYRVKKQIREMVLFAAQDLITDPPFSKLDLISCRNLLIYIEASEQERILSLFHFALREGGFLFLGKSESTGQRGSLFRPLSKKWRLFQRMDSSKTPPMVFPLSQARGSSPLSASLTDDTAKKRDHARLVQKALLERHAPPAVLVDHDCRVLYFQGRISDYLGPSTGEPSDDILALAGEHLRSKLRGVLNAARKAGGPVSVRGARVQRGSDWILVEITVDPLPLKHAESLLLVSFHDQEVTAIAPPEEAVTEDAIVIQLEAELNATKEDLRSTIEQMGTANEELMTSNEEVVSMNEELQSTNEELETSREELQSLNEELTTLNTQLEDKLQQLELVNNDLDNLLSSTSVATLFLDTRFFIRRFTPATTELMNLIPSDVGRSVTDIAWNFRDETLLEDARRVMLEDGLAQSELNTEEGKWFLRRITPYRTETHETQGVVLTFTDITQRKRSELALRESELMRRRVSDALPMLISYVDPEMRYRFNNEAYSRWFGIPVADIQGKAIWELLGREAFENLEPHFKQVLAGERDSLEYAIKIKGGENRYVLADLVPDTRDDGTVAGFFALITDLSERRRAEQRIESLNRNLDMTLQRLRLHMENTPLAMLEWEADLSVRYWNSAAESLFGWTSEEAVGKSLLELGMVHPDEKERVDAALNELIKGEVSSNISSNRNIDKDGGVRHCNWYNSVLFDDEGTVVSMFSYALDLTERTRMETALREKSLQLETEAKRKNDFLAMLGHELRNPLVPIRTAAELLLMKDGDPETLKWVIRMLERQTGTLMRLVDDLLDMARIVRGGIKLNKILVDLREISRDAVDAVEADAEAKHQAIRLELPDKPVPIRVDATRITQVLTNLLVNAVKFTQETGNILIRVGTQWPEAVVRVEDDGRGITPELMPEIFELFSHEKVPLDKGGLGLGLTLSKRLVETHGGTITAASDGEGQGACFTIRLPLDNADPGLRVNPTRKSVAKPVASVQRVLVVDDNPDVAESFLALCSSMGHETICECDPTRVIDRAREFHPTVLLLDIGLPGIDGYTLARQLREIPEFHEVHMVAVSGYGQEEFVARSREAGFDDYLLKPVTLDKLENLLG